MHSIIEPAQEAADPALVQAEINALQTQLVVLDAELKRRDLKIQQLTLELAYLKRVRFGCKSEALTAEQRDLFLETGDEDGAAIVVELEEQQNPAEVPRPHKRSGRNPLPPELPRIEHRHEPESCTCGACGRELVKIGEDISEQLVDRLAYLLKQGSALHADETPVQQLDPGSGKTKRAYMWAYRSNDLENAPRIVVFDYQTSRSGAHARAFLEDWRGHLMVDDYGGYVAAEVMLRSERSAEFREEDRRVRSHINVGASCARGAA